MPDQPPGPESLLRLTTRFLDPAATADERQALRRATSTPAFKQAYEQHYVDGAGMDQPQVFIRHTLAALYLTSGFTSRESAQQILAELRDFAGQEQVDFDAIYTEVRSLPGARRSRSTRRRFVLVNIGLFVVLILGTITIHNMTVPPLQTLLQLVLLAGVIAGQLLLLYRHLT